jgi:hypothetical protein
MSQGIDHAPRGSGGRMFQLILRRAIDTLPRPARRGGMLLPIGMGLLVSGCSALSGGFGDAVNTLDVHGPTSLAGTDYVPPAAPKVGDPAWAFVLAWNKALEDELDMAKNGKPEPTDPASPISIEFKELARKAVALEGMNCADFFNSRGDDQKGLLVAKDITTTLGSAATGVLALASPSNATAAGAAALFTGTAYNGVDIYTRNFLFGSDNIWAVQDLTQNALKTHADAAFPNTGHETAWTWDNTLLFISQHQDICGPAHIRALALEAISSGTVAAYDPSGTAFTPPAGAPQPPTAPPKSPTDNAAAAANAAAPLAAAAAKAAAPALTRDAPAVAAIGATAAVDAAVPAAVAAQAKGADLMTARAAALDAATNAALVVIRNAAQTAQPGAQRAFAAAIAGPIAQAAVAGAASPAAPAAPGRAQTTPTTGVYVPADHNSSVHIRGASAQTLLRQAGVPQ